MPKQKTLAELNAEKENIERQLAQEQHKIQRLENRAAYYEKGDRRKRAHRLITRGAAIESVSPQTKELYLKQQQEDVEKMLANEKIAIPDDFDYFAIKGIRQEAKEKLSQIRPINLGQASRISGVSPADISVLSIYVKKR